MRRRLVVAVVRVSSAVLRLVAEVPAALVQVAPVEVELFDDVFVMPSTPMVHLDGLLEGGAEVAIERVEALCLVEAYFEGVGHALERAFYFPELLVTLVQLTQVYVPASSSATLARVAVELQTNLAGRLLFGVKKGTMLGILLDPGVEAKHVFLQRISKVRLTMSEQKGA